MLASSTGAAPSVVQVRQSSGGGWQLLRNGEAHIVRGAGVARTEELKLLRTLGGTTIRTWTADALERQFDGRSLIDRADALELTVVAGLLVRRAGPDFDYHDQAKVRRQRDEILATVRRYKGHPALLMWGLGNEMEGQGAVGSDPQIWRELNVIATLIKSEDANHPIVTAIAGTGQAKITAILEHYPALDVLGVNVYGGAARAGATVVARGWTKPYLLTEYGPTGPWETAKTPWGASIEQTAEHKAERYLAAALAAETAPSCLGALAFLWGHSGALATTATWFGLLLPGGEKLPAADTLAHVWTGRWPLNRSPRIDALEVAFAGARVRGGQTVDVAVVARDEENDSLRYSWAIVPERTLPAHGDSDAMPASLADSVVRQEGGRATLRLPQAKGAYRLFCYVRDGAGGANVRNVPFFVEGSVADKAP